MNSEYDFFVDEDVMQTEKIKESFVADDLKREIELLRQEVTRLRNQLMTLAAYTGNLSDISSIR